MRGGRYRAPLGYLSFNEQMTASVARPQYPAGLRPNCWDGSQDERRGSVAEPLLMIAGIETSCRFATGTRPRAAAGARRAPPPQSGELAVRGRAAEAGRRKHGQRGVHHAALVGKA